VAYLAGDRGELRRGGDRARASSSAKFSAGG
jgi:hypothetical protein